MIKIAAIITARGGSKGVPRKNIREVCGKPLIAYSIEAALNCPLIGRCYVSTEDHEISEISKQWGAEVIDRPADLATDSALSSDVVVHALNFLHEQNAFPEYFVLLQPTSPLRNSRHLEECLAGYLRSGKRSAVSITEAEHHPWKMLLEDGQGIQPVVDMKTLESPRQLLPKAFRINGAIYCLPSLDFLEQRLFYLEPAYMYVMSQYDSLDIDSEVDLRVLELLLQDRALQR